MFWMKGTFVSASHRSYFLSKPPLFRNNTPSYQKHFQNIRAHRCK